jgi:hypothetical protein
MAKSPEIFIDRSLGRKHLAEALEEIDGYQLCDLLKEYELGVRCTIRHAEDVVIVPEFFAEL